MIRDSVWNTLDLNIYLKNKKEYDFNSSKINIQVCSPVFVGDVRMFFNNKESVILNNDEIKVAIIGRPNVGKSSIFNSLVGKERSIVSNVAGTTRDAIDTPVNKDGINFLFIDTAGMRRKARIDEPIEKYSIIRCKNFHIVLQ